MKKALLLLTASFMSLSLPACTYDHHATDLPPGQYEKTTKSVDANGTTTKTTDSTDVYYDENGNKKATVDTKTSRDPKGLFNESTTETHETEQ